MSTLLLCLKSILLCLNLRTLVIYVFTFIIIYELQIFFSRGIAGGIIDYDFETGLLFARNPCDLIHSFSPWVIIYDQKVFWHTLKKKYVSRLVMLWIGISKLWLFKELYRSVVGCIGTGEWYDIILTLMFRTLSLLFILPKMFMTLFYSTYILRQVWELHKSKHSKEVCRLYIHELFQTFFFFKIFVPKNFYAYVVGKGLTFYTTDVTKRIADFSNFGFYTPLKLSFVFNIFVAPYYTAFRRIQSVVWLLSPLQSFYVIELGGTQERFLKPDDLRGIQPPVLRIKENTQSLCIRLLSVLLFLLIDHVRAVVSLPAIMYGRICLQASTWNNRTQKFERLTLDHTLREGWEGIMCNIFEMMDLRALLTLYVPDTIETLMIGLSTQNLDIDNPNWPAGTRFTISTEGDSKLFVKRPTRNWAYSGIYFHTTLAEFFFKLEWRYFFIDTRNFWCHERENLLTEIWKRIVKYWS